MSARSVPVFACLVVGCNLAAPVGPPRDTIEEYVQAVRADDFGQMYNLMDADVRAEVSREEFERLLGENAAELDERVAELENLTRDGLEARARVRLDNGETVVLVLEDGRWVIDGGVLRAPSLRTPRDAVLALRTALARGSLEGLQRVLARQPRAELEADIQQLLDDTEDEFGIHWEEMGNGNRALVRTTTGREFVVVREAGEWRILELRDP